MGRPNKKISKTCNYCNELFLAKFSEVKDGGGKYCCRDCYIKSRKGKRIFPIGTSSWNKGKKLSKEHCKNLSLSHIGKDNHQLGRKHTISTRIKMSVKRLGIDIKNWNGFVSDNNKLERIKFRNEIQNKVFERDNYTCQMCGTHGGYLQVDHIQSWVDYIDLRFDINNCRTLCMDCHYFITFGKKKPENVIWGHNLSHQRRAIFHN
jgi:hypothetical protein